MDIDGASVRAEDFDHELRAVRGRDVNRAHVGAVGDAERPAARAVLCEQSEPEQPAVSPAIMSMQFGVRVPAACALGVVIVKVGAEPKFHGLADCPLTPNSAVGATRPCRFSRPATRTLSR